MTDDSEELFICNKCFSIFKVPLFVPGKNNLSNEVCVICRSVDIKKINSKDPKYVGYLDSIGYSYGNHYYRFSICIHTNNKQVATRIYETIKIVMANKLSSNDHFILSWKKPEKVKK